MALFLFFYVDVCFVCWFCCFRFAFIYIYIYTHTHTLFFVFFCFVLLNFYLFVFLVLGSPIGILKLCQQVANTRENPAPVQPSPAFRPPPLCLWARPPFHPPICPPVHRSARPNACLIQSSSECISIHLNIYNRLQLRRGLFSFFFRHLLQNILKVI